MENLPFFNENRAQLYTAIHEYIEAGYSFRRIASILHVSRNTIPMYVNGSFEEICCREPVSKLSKYYDLIVELLSSGFTKIDAYNKLREVGYSGSLSNTYDYMNKIIKEKSLSIQTYKSLDAEGIKKQKDLQKFEHLSRNTIFKYLWMGEELKPEHRLLIFNKYPIIRELNTCIRNFRQIFRTKKMPLLYLFIEHYKNSNIKKIASFAHGVERDINAIENAVASNLSNGFVEGSNNRVKAVKRIMYGRCKLRLLAAKLIYKSPLKQR